jgi:hypothetical protein
LHALAVAGVAVPEIDTCSKYVRSLLCTQGGFCGSIDDNVSDCEYTFYGLLAMGHLVGND